MPCVIVVVKNVVETAASAVDNGMGEECIR
jgi:hypothetical protein